MFKIIDMPMGMGKTGQKTMNKILNLFGGLKF